MKRFYIRRVLRLAPALASFVIFFFILWDLLFDIISVSALSAALFYYFNYFRLSVGPDFYPPYNVLWSLAVEEHFYIIFPCIFIFCGGMTNKLLRLLITFITIALLWRMYLFHAVSENWIDVNPEYFKKATDTRFDSIIYGVLLATAVALYSTRDVLTALRTIPAALSGVSLIIIGLGFKLPFFYEAEIISSLQYTLRYTLTGIGLFLSLNYVLFSPKAGAIRAALSTGILVYIGKLSYSIYLWHLAILVTAKKLYPEHIGFEMTFACALLTVFFSMISYHFVELRFIKLRHRFGSNA